MEYLLSAKQMKDCDAYTISGLGIPSVVLMERAALAIVDEIEKAKPDLSRVLVVCGSGNNGGDGFAAARLLSERYGGYLKEKGSADECRITLAFVGKETSMTEETALQRKICENCGMKICTNFMDGEYTTIVDAIFGIGLSRAVEGRYAEIIDWMNESGAFIVSADIPSGISADDGRILGTAVRANLTVTLAGRKIGQILYPGAEYCGRLICRKIGIPVGETSVFTYSDQDFNRVPARRAHSHKGTYGRVLLIAGSEGMSGAAVLAAKSAFRSGCGMVRVFTPECNRAVIQICLPEAIVTTWNPDRPEEEGLTRLQEAAEWSDVIGIGPGLGTSGQAWTLLRSVLGRYRKPMVIDADALNLLSMNRDSFAGPAMKLQDKSLLPAAEKEMKGHVPSSVFGELPDTLRGNLIVTPHVGEMARLMRRDSSEIAGHLMDSAKTFAREEGVICVLKDARTVVSDGSEIYLNTSGNDGMATAGSGDVLTGLLCGLLAQGMPCFEAARMGVFLHGRAGDLACDELGGCGMKASDIADKIGTVMHMAHEARDSAGAGRKPREAYIES